MIRIELRIIAEDERALTIGAEELRAAHGDHIAIGPSKRARNGRRAYATLFILEQDEGEEPRRRIREAKRLAARYTKEEPHR